MRPKFIAAGRDLLNDHQIKTLYLLDGDGNQMASALEGERRNGNSTRFALPVAEWATSGVESIYLSVPDEARPAPPIAETPIPERFPDPPYSKIVWPCPYRSQRDNDRDPRDNGSYAGNECAPTSVAMAIMAFAAIDPAINQRLKDLMARHNREQPEDAIAAALYQDYGMTVPGTVDLMAKLMRSFGLEVRVDMASTSAKIRAALDRGALVVAHGSFTPSGHVVAIRGYNESAGLVNDPWGEFFAAGYRHGAKIPGADSLGAVLGDNCPYPWDYLGRVVYWHHEVSHPTLRLIPLEAVPKP